MKRDVSAVSSDARLGEDVAAIAVATPSEINQKVNRVEVNIPLFSHPERDVPL